MKKSTLKSMQFTECQLSSPLSVTKQLLLNCFLILMNSAKLRMTRYFSQLLRNLVNVIHSFKIRPPSLACLKCFAKLMKQLLEKKLPNHLSRFQNYLPMLMFTMFSHLLSSNLPRWSFSQEDLAHALCSLHATLELAHKKKS